MFDKIIEILNTKNGIEFGGPTELFSDNRWNMPLYNFVQLDGGNLKDDNHFQKIGENFVYSNKTGKQFNVDCASDLSVIENKRYDFIVTSHVIEHIANPIKSIRNWKKILNKDGYILSVMPDYRFCFDHNRPLTTLEHLIEDFLKDVGEDDKTHIEEQKTMHDWAYGGHKDFYSLCDINEKTRVVHHHTFDEKSFKDMMEHIGFETVISFKQDDLNIVNLSRML